MRPLTDLFSECDRHLQALDEAIARCPRPLTEAHFKTRDPLLIAAVDQFAFRFSKLQDVMGGQLFRRFAVDVLREPLETAPFIDVVNLLERTGVVPSADRWQQLREMRNAIAHEYEDEPALLASTLEAAMAMVAELREAVARLRREADTRR